uniref:Protein kinase domain-containing protein n=1 Tax=Panagrellus redivivus TaxID=6233 RepID=A0A7E4VAR2_PANRE
MEYELTHGPETSNFAQILDKSCRLCDFRVLDGISMLFQEKRKDSGCLAPCQKFAITSFGIGFRIPDSVVFSPHLHKIVDKSAGIVPTNDLSPDSLTFLNSPCQEESETRITRVKAWNMRYPMGRKLQILHKFVPNRLASCQLMI